MDRWRQLIVPKKRVPRCGLFKCGHPRSKANSVIDGKYPRCLECKRFQARRWYAKKVSGLS